VDETASISPAKPLSVSLLRVTLAVYAILLGSCFVPFLGFAVGTLVYTGFMLWLYAGFAAASIGFVLSYLLARRANLLHRVSESLRWAVVTYGAVGIPIF